MGVLVSLTTGLVFWICAWALDVKAFDAFLVTVLLVVIAITIRAVRPFLRRLLGHEPPPLAESV